MGRRVIRLDGADIEGPGERRAPRRPQLNRAIMRPGDERGFIHKKLLGAVGSIAGILPIPAGGLISTVARRLSGGGQVRRISPRPTVSRASTARTTPFSRAEKAVGQSLKFGGGDGASFGGVGGLAVRGAPGGGGCIFPFRRDPRSGECKIFLGDRPGPDDRDGGVFTGPVGDAVMGRFGAGLVPGEMTISRAVCLRGMQLGVDGLCYNKGQITNKQRMWPRGRRPLLTGGDMRAIGIAARAGSKLERTTTRLRKLGMMKALPKGRGGHRHAKAATGVVSV